MSKLTAAERHALPSDDFALPGGRYPINDPNHARNALARVSQHGNSEEKSEVRSAVHHKYPSIGGEHPGHDPSGQGRHHGLHRFAGHE